MAGQARQASFAGEDFRKPGKYHLSVESYLGGLLACPVVVLPRLTGKDQQACDLYQACQISTALGMSCIEQDTPWSGSASKPPRQSSTTPSRLPVTLNSLVKIFTGKTGSPSLTRYFCAAWVRAWVRAL